MATTLASAVQGLLKNIYLDSPAALTKMYESTPLLAWLPRSYNLGGKSWVQAVGSAYDAGVSNTYSNAVANANVPDAVNFNMSPVRIYGIRQIDRMLLMMANSDQKSFLNLAADKADWVLRTVVQMTHRQLYRSGTGSIGQRASLSTNTITLSNPADVANFWVGLVVVASSTDGGSLRTGSTTVTAVNRDAGTVTVASAAAITSFANNDYLYIQGNAANGGTNVAITGLDGWLPSTVTSTPFWGVDRTVDTANLAGSRIDAAALGYNARDAAEALITAIQTVNGAPPDILFAHPKVVSVIRLITSDNQRFPMDVSTGLSDGKTELFLKGFSVDGVPLVADYACGVSDMYALTKSAIELNVVNPSFPELSVPSRDIDSADGIEIRSANYMNLRIKRPIACGRVSNVPTTI